MTIIANIIRKCCIRGVKIQEDLKFEKLKTLQELFLFRFKTTQFHRLKFFMICYNIKVPDFVNIIIDALSHLNL